MTDIRDLRQAALAAVGLLLAATAPAWSGTTERVSISSSGTQGNGDSEWLSISAAGRFVAFHSDASNLVPGDTNGVRDVFVRDRKLGTTERVSVSSSGTQGDGFSGGSSISADGRLVAFVSGATNLVPGDTNGFPDVFVRDRVAGTTERVSVSSRGKQGNGDSGFRFAISADGRFVAFWSSASNLVPGDTNGVDDVFVRDRELGTTERVSVSSRGKQANGESDFNSVAISRHGRFVAFDSYATNLVPHDTNTVCDADGCFGSDIFVRDRLTGKTERVNVSSSSTQANGNSYYPSITGDGRFIAFASDANNLVPGDTNSTRDAFVRDRWTRTTERVSVGPRGVQADRGSNFPSISADGHFVAFESDATNLAPHNTNDFQDIFVRDHVAGTTERVSVSSSGAEGNDASFTAPAISADGRFVAFSSYATNLVPRDTNGFEDVFVRTR